MRFPEYSGEKKDVTVFSSAFSGFFPASWDNYPAKIITYYNIRLSYLWWRCWKDLSHSGRRGIMMMNKKPYRSDMISFFLGKRKCFSDRTGNPPPHFAIRAFDIISFSCLLTHRAMAGLRKNLFVRFPEIRINNSALPVNARGGDKIMMISFYISEL